MFGILRGLLKLFGPIPILAMIGIVWFIANKASEERSKSAMMAEGRTIAGPHECFGAFTTASVEGFSVPAIRVTSTKIDSPADSAGILPGDVIIAENEQPLQSLRLWQRQPMSGQTVYVRIMRPTPTGAQEFEWLEIPVTLGHCRVLLPPN